MKNSVLPIILIIIGINIGNESQAQTIMKKLKYPFAPKCDLVEYFFGQKVSDPHRRLENLADTASANWYSEQKKNYKAIMNRISSRDAIKEKIKAYTYSSNAQTEVPKAIGNRVYYIRRYYNLNSEKLLFRESSDSQEIEIFNTETINTDKVKHTIDYFQPSLSGQLVAIGVSKNGNEMSDLMVLNPRSKIFLPEKIERTMYGNPHWLAEDKGFFYTQCKEIITEEDKLTMFENMKVKLHILGEPVKNDREIFSKDINTVLNFNELDVPLLYINPTSQKAIVQVTNGSSSYLKLYSTDLKLLLTKGSASIKWEKISSESDGVTDFAFHNNNLYVVSTNNNPLGCLEKINLDSLQKRKVLYNAKNIILEGLILNKNYLYVNYSKNGTFDLLRMEIASEKIENVHTGLNGTIEINPAYHLGINYFHSDYLYLRASSFVKDWSVYYYNIESKGLVKTNINPSDEQKENVDLIIEKVDVASSDGTLVPLTIIHSKNIKFNGKNPTILYAYGAYGVSLNPRYKSPLRAWYDEGGIYAIAHVRGGGEKGEEWYKGGLKPTKANSWKDYIACAEYLISKNYTSSTFLGAEGGSAGGITIGRAMTERPDLFKAVVLSYAALNMLRDEFSGNNFGITEFGTVKDSVEFKYLYDMDVYHHISENIQYPSVLFTTALNDTKVAFWQPGKVAARMQEVSQGKSNTILLRVSEQGHLGDVSASEEQADKYSFFLWQFGLEKFKLKETPH